MFPKQWSSYTGKERRFQHTSDVVLRFPEASSFGRISSQGLLFQCGIIPARRNPPPGIIFPEWNHLCSKKSPARDYFSELKASFPEEILRWGLFSRGRCIPARRNPPPGIIFPSRKHPCSKNCSPRDYFPRAEASPRGRQAITG